MDSEKRFAFYSRIIPCGVSQGFFIIDLVGSLFGDMVVLTRVIYGLVEVVALYSIYVLSVKTQ